jgi:hypothetical protein
LTIKTPAVYPPNMRLRLERRHRLTFAFLAVLALCAGLLIESFATHTDDGCVVESHCLACRLTVGGVAVAAVSIPLLDRARETTEIVSIDDEQLRSESVAVILPSRAPPAV